MNKPGISPRLLIVVTLISVVELLGAMLWYRPRARAKTAPKAAIRVNKPVTSKPDPLDKAFEEGKAAVRNGGAWSVWSEGTKLCSAEIKAEQMKGWKK